jgi:hypothetical protein
VKTKFNILELMKENMISWTIYMILDYQYMETNYL